MGLECLSWNCHAGLGRSRFPGKTRPTRDGSHNGYRRSNLPSNLLNDVTNESGALAQAALGAGDLGLADAGGSLL